MAFSGAQASNLAKWDLKRIAQQQEIRQERRIRHLAPRVAINAVQVKAKEIETEFLDGHQMTWGGGSGEQEEDDAAGLVLTEASEFPTVVNPPNAIESLTFVNTYLDYDHPGEEGCVRRRNEKS